MLGLFLLGMAAQSPAYQGNNASSGADFTGDFPVVSGKGALTVSGNDYRHRKLYEDGEVPTLSAYDEAGDLLPDGIYRFQFTSTPEGSSRSARQRDVLQGGASSSAVIGSTRATHLSGTFEVLGGQLIYR
jgi:hypothetical protein